MDKFVVLHKKRCLLSIVFHNERDKSTTFEELICNCFKHAPVYTSQISDVWMWKDFPRL